MSLINEALKKARQAQPVASTAATPALRPVEPAPHADNGGGLWLPLLIGVTLLTSGILLWQWFASGHVETVRARSTSAATLTPAALPVGQVKTPVEVNAPVPAPSPVPIPPVAADAKAAPTNTLATLTEPSGTTTNVAIADAPKPPAYKLQGIIYRPKNPSAVIDGKLVFAGSRVGEAHVLLIEKDAVTIVTPAGQTNLLELP